CMGTSEVTYDSHNYEDILRAVSLIFYMNVVKRCHLNISSKTQDMMENMAEETMEAHLETTKQRLTRKRKKICYTKSSEEDHSSDSEYIEKSKGKQTKRSHRKANCDGMDKFSSVETSEAPKTSENIDTSREIIQSTQQASIFTLQKPIITKIMYDRYSPYLICAFNATINYIKETVEEGVYIKVKNLLQAKDRLILQETLVKKLDAIFETDYIGIESKIFSETVISGDNLAEEARFNFFIRDALLDFVANFRYRMPRVLDREISERTYIVEFLSPIFYAFRNAFPDIKYDWIEKMLPQ
ncbi:11987_t:CDS:2, partial [Funneliformis mosseae]